MQKTLNKTLNVIIHKYHWMLNLESAMMKHVCNKSSWMIDMTHGTWSLLLITKMQTHPFIICQFC